MTLIALGAFSREAEAACNLIPRAATTFRSALGSTNRPFAAPGEFFELKLRPAVGLCDGASPGFDAGLTDRVTVLFTPPTGPPNAVVLSTDCSFFDVGVENACVAALGAGGATATCIPLSAPADVKRVGGPGGETRLQVRFPLANVAAGVCSGGGNAGRTCRNDASCPGASCAGLIGSDQSLSGPAKIVVTDDASPLACGLASARCATSGATPGLVACIDEFFELDGTCRQDVALVEETFGGFTALPLPNDFGAACFQNDPPCTVSANTLRLTVDAQGNALVPVDWRGVLQEVNGVPTPRLVRGMFDPGTPIQIPDQLFLGSFTPEGAKLPPIFEPQFDPTVTTPDAVRFFGSADAPLTVLRLAKRHGTCVGGSTPGTRCATENDCPGGTCATSCVESPSTSCSQDTDCPSGPCGRLFDFDAAVGAGPLTLDRLTPQFCQLSPNQSCTGSGDCAGGTNACVSYALEAETLVPLEGLAGTPDVFAFTINEGVNAQQLNDDADITDYVVQLRDRDSGAVLPIGSGGKPSRAVTRVSEPPFRYPALATENDLVAFLEPEPLEGNCAAPASCDANGNASSFESMLRVYRRSALGDQAVDLLPGNQTATSPMPLIDGQSVVASNQRVFSLVREADGAEQVTERVSIADDESQGNGRTFGPPVISSDGRYVAFSSEADNLVGADTNGEFDVFVRDRVAGTTVRVSVDDSGGELPFGGLLEAASADGRSVVFSVGLILMVRDLDAATTRRVSVASDGTPGDGSETVADSVSVSRSGRFIVFISSSTNLVPGDTNTCGGFLTPGSCPDVFIRDRDLDNNGVFDEVGPGRTLTERISIGTDGRQHLNFSLDVAMHAVSDDGRYVVFVSDDPDLLPIGEDNNAGRDILLRDRWLGTTTRMSVRPDGSEASGGSIGAESISGNGQYVAFNSSRPYLPNSTPGDVVYVREVSGRELEIASIASDGTQPNSNSSGPMLSRDGRFVSFSSSASNLFADDANAGPDLVLKDRASGMLRRVNLDTSGNIVAFSGYGGSVSDLGQVVFESPDGDAIGPGNDTNGVTDVFVRGADPLDAGSDLTGDGDVSDTVLRVVDASGPGSASAAALCPASRASVASGAAAFLRPESAGATTNPQCTGATLTGPDLNGPARAGDGDTSDEVVHFWSPTTGMRNLGCAATDVKLSTSHLAALVSEAGEGSVPSSRNGDGDTSDGVLEFLPVSAIGGGFPSSCNDWTSTGQAADAFAVSGSWLAMITPESAQGTMNSVTGGTRDGDSADRVLQLWNAAGAGLVPVADASGRLQPAQELVLGDRVVAFRTREGDLCGSPVDSSSCQGVALPAGCTTSMCDLNGDGDCCDDVMQAFDLETSELVRAVSRSGEPPRGIAVTPCTFEACDPRAPYRVTETTVRFLTFECDQGGPMVSVACPTGGTDLDGDGDGDGFVLQEINTRTKKARVLATVDPVASDAVDPLAADPLQDANDGTVVFVSEGACVETIGGFCTPATEAVDCGPGAFCEGSTCKRLQGVCVTNSDCPGASLCEARPIVPASADTDHDGVADALDDCPRVANAGQEDADGDGVGDACDAQTCGDGVLQDEAGEACDDGNTVGGDGCEANCSKSAVASGCASIGNAKLKLTKLAGTASDEGLTFTGKIQFGPGQPSGFSPLNSLGRGAQLLIEDLGAGNASIYELSHRTKPVPPGAKGTVCSSKKKDGWTANAAQTTYVYGNATNALSNASCAAASAKGLKTFKLIDKRAAATPSIDFSIRAAKGSIATPVGPLRATVVLSATPAEGLAGACGQVSFASCAFNATGSTLTCE